MVTRTWLPESTIRSPQAWPLNPPKTSEWITPSRAQASIATGSSGTIGRWNVTLSPALRWQTSLSSAANSLTLVYRSWYVSVFVSSSSASGTQTNAALFLFFGRCLVTQFEQGFELATDNPLPKGRFVGVKVLLQYLSQLSRSAYSLK